MDYRTLVDSLSKSEKQLVFDILSEEIGKRSNTESEVKNHNIKIIRRYASQRHCSISQRLLRGICNNFTYDKYCISESDLEELYSSDLLRFRNIGKNAVIEFEKIRGKSEFNKYTNLVSYE